MPFGIIGRMRGLELGAPRNRRITVLSVLLGLSLPLLIPAGHMLLFQTLWGSEKREVDPDHCTCDCWDAVFKGPYESGYYNSYKHVYFNITPNTFKMWVITFLFFVALYEVIKHLTLLWFKGRVRYRMALLLLTSIHSHYFAWWGQWNYWNDDFYDQWNHQMFFTLTEGLSTICVLTQLDRRRPLDPGPLILVGTIALFHVGCGMNDQFFRNIVLLEGQLHQVLRDIPLLFTDIGQIFLVWKELKGYCVSQGVPGVIPLLTGNKYVKLMYGVWGVMFLYVWIFPETSSSSPKGEEDEGIVYTGAKNAL